MEDGTRLLVPCVDGGPCTSRLVIYPPPLEVGDRGGLYVLDDQGAIHEWRYVWIPAN